ncbi:hypothetical protein [Neisseria gonorrhoeae]|uniref:hypothetical protein n=1 Tax=Neisseria gonorrhoeae TaxID=485 RepID=UPI0021A6C196|nr:hypothetical protein [Neisseria gonorrhoeae]UWT37929.1 hypothetical protein NDQ65_02420 [Neisseria gonorrhoeae]
MKTRNIAFKFAVLAAVLAAGYASDSPRRRKPYGKGKTRRYRQCAWRWLKSRRKLTN